MNPLAFALKPLGWALRRRRAGDVQSIFRHPAWQGPETLELTTPAFQNNTEIPDRHCSLDLGPNLSPEFHWKGIPAETQSLVLIMEDCDVPFAEPGIHMVAVFSPEITEFAEGRLSPDGPEVRFVPGRRGRTGYFGPRPFPGHGVHHYRLGLFALDTRLPADRSWSDLAELSPDAQGHVLARGVLQGWKRG